jgi:4-hydroxybenzoate polyprenyltransferase
MNECVSKIYRGLLDALFVTRPVLWIPVWGFSALGYWRGLGGDAAPDPTAAWHNAEWGVFVGMFLFSMSVGAVYVINQIADYAVDALNDGFPLLVRGGISRVRAGQIAAAVALLSIISLLLRSGSLALCAAAALTLGVFYSFKPGYLSGRPFCDFCANAAGYGIIAFGVGWILSGSGMLTPRFVRAAAPYFLLMCAGSISSTIPDIAGDRTAGKITTAVFLGAGTAHLLACGFLLCAAGFALVFGDWVALTCAALSLPFYAAFVFVKSRRIMEATYKVGGGVTMLLAGYVFPVIIIPSILALCATWAYFRFRYQVNYPSLLPASHVSPHS